MERKEQLAHLDELMPLIKEQLGEGKSVTFFPRGVSMLPMLRQGIDSVVFSPITKPLVKYDLPLYQYPDGKYFLHRIVSVKEDYFICLGDNTYRYEKVKPEYAVAVVTSFKRGRKVISVNTWHYRLYCRVWVCSYPLRHLIKRGIGWIGRCIR